MVRNVTVQNKNCLNRIVIMANKTIRVAQSPLYDIFICLIVPKKQGSFYTAQKNI